MNRVPRVVLYSHDTMGLGHMRRNLLLAQALSFSRTPPAVLMVFGAGEANAWRLPRGTEGLTLPAVKKGPAGYQSRSFDLPIDQVIAIRRRALSASLDAFSPDLVIVDKVPGGLLGELRPAIRSLRRRGTRFVLGLRDILDEPSAVRSEWLREGSYAMVAECYDAVWVYGDPSIGDPAAEYGFGPEITGKLHYTGYLDPTARLDHAASEVSSIDVAGPMVLCLVGGGQDGAPLTEAFAEARYPAGTTGVIVAGPQMSEPAYQGLLRRTSARADLRVHRFVPDLDRLLARADQVVSMGGYNTVMELLAHERRALVVPRVIPRTEQLIRAERLAARGLVDLLHPDDLSAAALTDWLSQPAGRRPRARQVLDFAGLSRVTLLSRALLAAPRRRPVRLPAGPALVQAVG